MSWRFSNEATANAARTRQKPPSIHALAGASDYRGFFLIQRGAKVHIWQDGGPYGARWLTPAYSENEARAVVDQILGGAA